MGESRFIKFKLPIPRSGNPRPLLPSTPQMVPVTRPEYRLPGSLSESGVPEFKFHLQAGCLNEDADQVFVREGQHLSATQLANTFRLWLLEVMSAANPLPFDFEMHGFDTDPADEEE